MRKYGLYAAMLALLVSACSGGGNAFKDPGTTGGGGGNGGGAAVATLTVVSSSSTIPSDGSAPATITAYVRDANNALLKDVPVTFSASSGGVGPASANSDANGAAITSLSTAGDASLRTITVTARTGSLTATVDVQVAATSGGGGNVQLGSGTGAQFTAGTIAISNANVSAGGSTSLTVTLVQSGGTLYTTATPITFSSACIGAGTATITPNATSSTSTGILTVTYSAKGCAGSDVISAQAVVNGTNLTATGVVTVAAAAVGAINFTSATPTNIALQGTGDASRPESSTVVFKVVDSTNGPVAGATVTFTLNTTIGGLSLTPATATSDAQGRVQTVVSAGTVATSVKVTATVTSVTPNISTQSSQLTVTTGIPTAASFSLAVGCFNIEGWDIDGTTTTVTARLGDRFQNPVPDGTAVTFTSEGGNIQSQCTTATTPTEGGVCSVSYRSSNPRPLDGRVTLLATAIGEESFVDSNTNGSFDNGETFTDLAEPYEDDNENAVYDVGEHFFDFNNNGTRDLPDGLFNGVLCKDTTGRCGAAGTRSTGIGQQNKIILSGSTPMINAFDGATDVTGQQLTMGFNSAKALLFYIRDINGNIMPGNTNVSLSASGAGLSVAQPTSFVTPCATPSAGTRINGQTTYAFTVQSSTTGGTGVVTLAVKTPSGLTSNYQFNIVVQ